MLAVRSTSDEVPGAREGKRACSLAVASDADSASADSCWAETSRPQALVDLGTSEGFASLQAVDAWHEKRRQEAVDIHQWKQLMYSVRTQVTSLHHNVCAAVCETLSIGAWRPEDCGDDVWLLGRRYKAAEDARDDNAHAVTSSSSSGRLTRDTATTVHGAESDGASSSTSAPRPCGTVEDFAVAWSQILRMTYRKGFAPMYRCVRTASASSEERAQYIRLTSDAGWGCMIRVGQMLLAATLKRLREEEASRRKPGKGISPLAVPPIERQFLDDPRADKSPFSIFKFIRTAYGREVTDPESTTGGGPAPIITTSSVEDGDVVADDVGSALPQPAPTRQLTEKKPGDWFGPTTVSETIAALVEQNSQLKGRLAVYVESDGVLYEDEVRALGHGHDIVNGVFPSVLAPPSPPTLTRQSPLLGTSRAGSSASGRPLQTRSPYQSPMLVPQTATRYKSIQQRPRTCSEDDFEMVSTASVSSTSGWNSAAASPLLEMLPPPQVTRSAPGSSAQAATTDSGEEFEEARGCEADVMVGSFSEAANAQWSLDGLDDGLDDSMLLPPPAEPLPEETDDEEHEVVASVAGGATSSSSCPASPALSSSSCSQRWKRPVLILFPLQLGLEKHVSQTHISSVLRYFELPCSLGAMGGRPRMAHFFVGRRGNSILYVDPHVVQPAMACNDDDDEEDFETFLNLSTVQTIQVDHIDSSISFAFFCRSEADLRLVIDGIRRVDATEADAPIRAEKTRPLALRGAQAYLAGVGLGGYGGAYAGGYTGASAANAARAKTPSNEVVETTAARPAAASWSDCDCQASVTCLASLPLEYPNYQEEADMLPQRKPVVDDEEDDDMMDDEESDEYLEDEEEEDEVEEEEHEIDDLDDEASLSQLDDASVLVCASVAAPIATRVPIATVVTLPTSSSGKDCGATARAAIALPEDADSASSPGADGTRSERSMSVGQPWALIEEPTDYQVAT